MDLKLWDEIAEVFTKDATADYGDHVSGTEPIRTWAAGRRSSHSLRDSLGPDIITLHAAGQPEIDVDGNLATGTWRFEDTVIATEYRLVIKGAAFYEDRYQRGADGIWRIAHTGYERIYEATMSLDDIPSWKFAANRWAPRASGPP